MNEPARLSGKGLPEGQQVATPESTRAKRVLIISLVAFGLLLVGMIAMMAVLAIDAYGTAPEPSPGAAVVSLIRDVAIVLVAFETMVIGALLVVLLLQVQALIVLLRDEIQPMLESVNDTVATVRGTARFMSENVVAPTVRAAGLLAGLRRVVKEAASLLRLGR